MKRIFAYVIFLISTTNAFAVKNPAPDALPTEPVFNKQQVTITTTVDPNKTHSHVMTITQKTLAEQIAWKTGDIGKQAEVIHIQENGANSVTLHRITGDVEPTSLLGEVSATGHVFVINPNGVIFDSDLNTVDLHGLLIGGVDMNLVLKEIEAGNLGSGENTDSFRIRVKDLINTVSIKPGEKKLAVAGIQHNPTLTLANTIVIDLHDVQRPKVSLARIEQANPNRTNLSVRKTNRKSLWKVAKEFFGWGWQTRYTEEEQGDIELTPVINATTTDNHITPGQLIGAKSKLRKANTASDTAKPTVIEKTREDLAKINATFLHNQRASNDSDSDVDPSEWDSDNNVTNHSTRNNDPMLAQSSAIAHTAYTSSATATPVIKTTAASAAADQPNVTRNAANHEELSATLAQALQDRRRAMGNTANRDLASKPQIPTPGKLKNYPTAVVNLYARSNATSIAPTEPSSANPATESPLSPLSHSSSLSTERTPEIPSQQSSPEHFPIGTVANTAVVPEIPTNVVLAPTRTIAAMRAVPASTATNHTTIPTPTALAAPVPGISSARRHVAGSTALSTTKLSSTPRPTKIPGGLIIPEKVPPQYVELIQALEIATIANTVEFKTASPVVFTNLIQDSPREIIKKTTGRLRALMQKIMTVNSAQDPSIERIKLAVIQSLEKLQIHNYQDPKLTGKLYSELQRNINRLVVLSTLKGNEVEKISQVVDAYNKLVIYASSPASSAIIKRNK